MGSILDSNCDLCCLLCTIAVCDIGISGFHRTDQDSIALALSIMVVPVPVGVDVLDHAVL